MKPHALVYPCKELSGRRGQSEEDSHCKFKGLVTSTQTDGSRIYRTVMVIFHYTPSTYTTMVGPLREVYVSLPDYNLLIRRTHLWSHHSTPPALTGARYE